MNRGDAGWIELGGHLRGPGPARWRVSDLCPRQSRAPNGLTQQPYCVRRLHHELLA
jgi:hypothetical protein